MNKKFSTLVASLLLGTAFGASAASVDITTQASSVVNGQYYFLSTPTSSDDALFIDGDSLKLVDDAANYPAYKRNYGLWKISYSNGVGGLQYTLVNKANGVTISLPAGGKATYAGGALNSFTWDATPATPTAGGVVLSSSLNAPGASKYVLQEVYVLQEDAEVTAEVTAIQFSGAVASWKMYKRLEVVAYLDAAAIDEFSNYTPSEIGGGGSAIAEDGVTATQKEIAALKAIVPAPYVDWTAVDQALAAITAVVTDNGSELTALQAAVKALPVNNYTLAGAKTPAVPATGTDNVTNSGIVYIAADATVVGAASGSATGKTIYKKGTKFVAASGVTTYATAPLQFEATLVGEVGGFMAKDNTASADAAALQIASINGGAGGTADVAALADDADKAGKFLATHFINEFSKGSENGDFTKLSTSVSFHKEGEDFKVNALAGKNIQIVQRNLLITAATGVGVATADGVNTITNYSKVTMIKDVDADKYLVVDTATFEPDNAASYNYKLQWKSLKDVTSFVTVADGTKAKFYTPNRSEGYHSAAYVWSVDYNVEKDSMIIKPYYRVEKGSAKYFKGDTVGATDGLGSKLKITLNSAAANKLQVSAKSFGSETNLTLVKSESDKVYPISTGVSFAPEDEWKTTTLSTGAYLINLVSDLDSRADVNGKYKVAGILSRDGKDAWSAEEVQKFVNMPAAQWIVEQNASTKLVKVYNRETGEVLNGYNNVQLYSAGEGSQVTLFSAADTLNFTPVTGNAVKDSTLGYFADKAENLKYKKFNLNYYNELNDTKLVDMKEDSTLFVNAEDGSVFFSVLPAGITELHKDVKVGNTVAVKGLKRTAYKLYLTGVNMKGDTVFVVKNTKGDGYRLKRTKSDATDVVSFYIAEYNNKVAETKTAAADKVFFAFVESGANYKMGVKDGGSLAISREALSEVRTSAFALVGEPAPMYRRLGVTNDKDGFTDMKTDTAKIYLTRNDQRFLYENTVNHIAGEPTGINYLGEYNAKQFGKSAALFIDTAYVRNNTPRPQYMLVLRPEFGKFIPCPEDVTHPDKYEYQVKGDYLVSLTDSLYGQKNQDQLFKFEEKTRLAFVPAIHHGDSLIMTSSRYTGNNKAIVKGEATTYASNDTIDLDKNAWSNVSFQFRLVDDGADANFYIESKEGTFVQILNGVPVLTEKIEDAERFNISAPTTDKPVANETIGTSSVSVVAANGAVIVNGAAGKNVVITNVLGQTIANTVLSSDNATIATPAGLVVVAVEGEAAVKAIVK